MSTMSAASSATLAATRPQPFADVITWLHTDEGEAWSRIRISQRLVSHASTSGIFADVLSDAARWNGAARWKPDTGWTYL